MTTVTMFAPVGSGGVIQTANSGNVFVKSDGTVQVDARDVTELQRAGFQIAAVRHANYTTPGAPGAASATAAVASVAISAGASVAAGQTLTVAAQPVVPRQIQAVIDPGTLAITGGNLVLTYLGNDGQTHIDSLPLTTALSTLLTVTSTYGVEHLTSAIINNLVGGVPGWLRGIGWNATLAVPIDPRAASITFSRESVLSTAPTTGITTGADEAVGTVGSNGLIAPTTVPNATQASSFGYSYNFPG